MTSRTAWITILLTAFVCAPAAAGVFVGDREWRQLTETVSLTGNEMRVACPTIGSPCKGFAVRASDSSSVDVDGWYWATDADVRELFEAVIQPGTTNFTGIAMNYANVDDPDIERMLSGSPTWFDHNAVSGANRFLQGMTAEPATNLRYGSAPRVMNSTLAGGTDTARSYDWNQTNRSANVGMWLYRPACSGPQLKTFTLSTALVAGCKSVTGRITLCGPSATSLVVNVSDTLAAATPPATVTIAAGTTTKSFAIKTAPVAAKQSGTVSVSLAGRTLEQPLAVRPMGLLSVSVTPSTIVGSQPALGTAKLECKAGPGPVEVALASNNSVVAAPVATSVIVPQAVQSATFNVTTNAVLARSYATISGTANGVTKTKKLTVNPAASVTPTSLKFGSVSVGSASAPQAVTLSNKGASSFTVTGIGLTGTAANWFVQSSSCPGTLAAGQSCTIQVSFRPLAAASKSARLTISTSATSTPLGVSLSGTGI